MVAAMTPLDPKTAFREAVLDFAEEPTPLNARRYLAASFLLAEAAGDETPAPAGQRASRSRRTNRRVGTKAASG
jgi:hypothetical protein